MTLQQLKYIIEISKYGSISRASAELRVAQPHLSSTLKHLEEELGITIFYRSQKGVELTYDGQEFLNYARSLLAQEEKILELYSPNKQKPIFKFRLSTQRYPFIIKAFFEFFEEYEPNQYEVHLREASMYCVINDVFHKKSEIGIIFISTATERFLSQFLSKKNLRFNTIKQVTPRVFFRKTHPMAKKETIDLDEMIDYPFASFENETSLSPIFSEEVLFYNPPAEKRQFFISDRGTMINILTHTDAFSIGTGILPEGFAGSNLVSRPIQNHESEIKLGWINSRETEPSETVLKFIKKIMEILNRT